MREGTYICGWQDCGGVGVGTSYLGSYLVVCQLYNSMSGYTSSRKQAQIHHEKCEAPKALPGRVIMLKQFTSE